MPIVPKFTQDDIKRRIDKFLDVIEKRQIQRLQYLGEMCVKHAKNIPPEIGFMDQSGNLRSSIGYMVFKNGVAVHEGFQGTSEGVRAGKNLAIKTGAKYKEGISLVVTAGMNYALALETGRRKTRSGEYYSARPCDVLTSTELFAKQELPKMVEEFEKKYQQSL